MQCAEALSVTYHGVGDFVPPVKTKNFLHRLNVVGLDSFEMASVQRPGFTAKEKNLNVHGTVNCLLARLTV